MITVEQVYQALQGVIDPELKRNLVELGMVREVDVTDNASAQRPAGDNASYPAGDRIIRVTLALTTLACPLKEQIVADVKQAVQALDGGPQVEVELTEMSREEKEKLGLGKTPAGQVEHLNQIRHVIAVMSGKGGVGKSLVSGLLAVALRQAGYQVGVLDADITGPSIPKMFFPNGARPGSTPEAMLPAESRLGIKVMSINLLLPSEDQAVIWRGPLIGRAIQQFWGDVLWGMLDYLVVDLPPGTSDAPLSVMQSLPVSGIVLVTSPQDLAGMVVRKAAQMAQQMNVPMLGLVENMSYFVCPDNGKQYDIFGPSHGETMAARLGIPFLGRLPIDPEIAHLCDVGRIEAYPAEAFGPIALRLADLAPQARRFG